MPHEKEALCDSTAGSSSVQSMVPSGTCSLIRNVHFGATRTWPANRLFPGGHENKHPRFCHESALAVSDLMNCSLCISPNYSTNSKKTNQCTEETSWRHNKSSPRHEDIISFNIPKEEKACRACLDHKRTPPNHTQWSSALMSHTSINLRSIAANRRVCMIQVYPWSVMQGQVTREEPDHREDHATSIKIRGPRNVINPPDADKDTSKMQI